MCLLPVSGVLEKLASLPSFPAKLWVLCHGRGPALLPGSERTLHSVPIYTLPRSLPFKVPPLNSCRVSVPFLCVGRATQHPL